MTATPAPPASLGVEHLDTLRAALDAFETDLRIIERWGRELVNRLTAGGRLLTVGNGGSAAHAEHLAAEFVGRYRDERAPFSALALHADGATLSALVNDYGPADMFARQVRAHARPGDVVIAFSTSGASPNVVSAAHAALDLGATVWSFTGQAPNPLFEASTEAVAVDTRSTPTVQEVHQVALHLLCQAFDACLPPQSTTRGATHLLARPGRPRSVVAGARPIFGDVAQTEMASRSEAGVEMAILRGLAFSATGITRRSTPAL